MLEDVTAERSRLVVCSSQGSGDEGFSQALPPAPQLEEVTPPKVSPQPPALLPVPPLPGLWWFSCINIHVLQPNSPALVIHKHALLFVYKYINFNLELLKES